MKYNSSNYFSKNKMQTKWYHTIKLTVWVKRFDVITMQSPRSSSGISRMKVRAYLLNKLSTRIPDDCHCWLWFLLFSSSFLYLVCSLFLFLYTFCFPGRLFSLDVMFLRFPYFFSDYVFRLFFSACFFPFTLSVCFFPLTFSILFHIN